MPVPGRLTLAEFMASCLPYAVQYQLRELIDNNENFDAFLSQTPKTPDNLSNSPMVNSRLPCSMAIYD